MIRLTLFFLLCTFVTSAQLTRVDDGEYEYQEIVKVDKTLAEIHNGVINYAAIEFRSTFDAIQIDSDKKIILKGDKFLRFPEGRINFTQIIDMKDGKYRVTFKNFILISSDGSESQIRDNLILKKATLKNTYIEIKRVMKNLKIEVENSSDDDDW